MNAGLGMGATPQGFGFGLPTAVPAAPNGAALPVDAANAEVLKGRFAALLAAIELGSEAGADVAGEDAQTALPTRNGAASSSTAPALAPNGSPAKRTSARNVESVAREFANAAGAVLRESEGRATSSARTTPELARFREWIVEMTAPRQADATTMTSQEQASVAELLAAAEAQPAEELDVAELMNSFADVLVRPTPTEPAAAAAFTAANVAATPALPRNASAELHASASTNRAVRSSDVAVRDLDALHPELKIRVERVVTRMQEEFGHTVEVVETVRSQARQNALYAQGRTAPGEVVTWTRDSLHRHGQAADLRVDGSWSNPEAYARLQQVAQEEGLSTLGPRDAGHVEWRTAGDTGTRQDHHRQSQVEAAVRTAVPTRSDAAAAATVANVAEVARVARVARPAAVADVAQVGRATRRHIEHREVQGRNAAREAEPSDSQAVAGVETAAAGVESASSQMQASTSQDGSNTQSNTHAHGGPQAVTHSAAPASTPDAPIGPPTGDRVVPSSTQAERIDRIDALDETRRQQPMQSITLRVEDAQGQDHRIRVDMRGNEVHADITAASGAQARAISDALPELRQRLGAQGLETSGVQVRTWLTDSAPSGERSAQRDGQQQQQQQQQSHRDPRQSHQAPRHWYDAEGDSV
jgi:hypothetical protein